MIWQNWAGNVTGAPSAIEVPETREAIVALIARARAAKQRVRVAGSGHSWGPLVPTDGVLVRMTQFAELSLSADKTILTLGPAVTVDQLAAFMIEHGVCVPSSVGIGLGEATMGGVFSTGCHGSGIALPSVSDWIVGVELVTSNGDVREFSLKRDGAEVTLTSFEYRILVVLARRAGETVTREELAAEVREPGQAKGKGQTYDPSVDRSLDVHVSRLRQKLEEDPKEPRLIKTVRGVGYVLSRPE